ncbi:hypothetical protein BH24ACT4_BH24ACT4_15460 [soil metagenome]
MVLALVAAACSGDEGATSTPREEPLEVLSGRTEVTTADLGPFALEPDGMAGPGTPLGGGLQVPDGSLLLGVPFPDLLGKGYRALLLVTGDPVAVFSAVAEQAGGLGMEGDGGCLTVPEGLGCSGRFVDGADGESLTVSALRRVGPAGVTSGLAVVYQPPGSQDPGAQPPLPPTPTDAVFPVPLPEGPIEGTDQADVVAAVRDTEGPPRTLEVGSRVVGLPGPCTCDGPGWSFVVELDGVERDVVAAYARQFTDLGEPPDISERLADELTILGVRVGSGSPVAEVRAVLPDSGPAYAIVSYVGE